jgi:acetolactate synthase-1/2/3 large subunit
MMMNLQELQTVVHYGLAVKIFLYANDGYLTIRQTQRALFGDHFVASGPATGVSCPDFAAIATAFGIPAINVSDPAEVDQAIAEILSRPGSALCQLSMDPQQLLGPKLSFSIQADGRLVSPPLEDLAPFLSRETLAREMLVGLHPKSTVMTDAVAEPHHG